MGDGKYRLVTDPSEGPKLFQIDTRVTSRGETAVLLTGIDCAERVVCHEAVSFDLAEGEFVFRLGAGNAAAVLDQLLKRHEASVPAVATRCAKEQAPAFGYGRKRRHSGPHVTPPRLAKRPGVGAIAKAH